MENFNGILEFPWAFTSKIKINKLFLQQLKNFTLFLHFNREEIEEGHSKGILEVFNLLLSISKEWRVTLDLSLYLSLNIIDFIHYAPEQINLKFERAVQYTIENGQILYKYDSKLFKWTAQRVGFNLDNSKADKVKREFIILDNSSQHNWISLLENFYVEEINEEELEENISNSTCLLLNDDFVLDYMVWSPGSMEMNSKLNISQIKHLHWKYTHEKGKFDERLLIFLGEHRCRYSELSFIDAENGTEIIEVLSEMKRYFQWIILEIKSDAYKYLSSDPKILKFFKKILLKGKLPQTIKIRFWTSLGELKPLDHHLLILSKKNKAWAERLFDELFSWRKEEEFNRFIEENPRHIYKSE